METFDKKKVMIQLIREELGRVPLLEVSRTNTLFIKCHQNWVNRMIDSISDL